ncbi:hypothetical protein [Streptomyces sp. SID13031]|uniref:hypothetical protein n=1 Tax=Streptomyces sp. SID13031 TaxID=2706046 RepID=UPI0013C5B220|nr:hypothetical protein [Streptomyces sp. SID13031]NEA34813.1 hypothetical protein [Streptomyces sp. SID13031]
MNFNPEKREQTPVAKPPPESLNRVDGGGPWGPTQFDLPEREDSNTQAVVIVTLIGVVALLVITVMWIFWYRQLN